jgi:hypothetical protein
MQTIPSLLRRLGRLGPVLLLLGLAATPISANGKFYAPPDRPRPGIPYQRAILVHKDGVQTLILQSSWQGKDLSRLAWVVPVPAVPEIGVFENVDTVRNMFDHQFRSSWPLIKHWSIFFIGIPPLILVCGLMFSIMRTRRSPAKRPIIYGLLGFLIILLYALLTPTIGMPRDQSSIAILSQHRLGPYEVTVLRAGKSDELLDWLTTNGFATETTDLPILNDYIAQNWVFVATKVAPAIPVDATVRNQVLDRESFAAPLILRFTTPDPVYPLTLTGSAGVSTEVRLYAYAPHRLDAGGRLPLTFCDERDPTTAITENADETSRSLLSGFDPGPWFLSAFHGTLSPAAMRSDLILTRAATDEPYRQVIWRW